QQPLHAVGSEFPQMLCSLPGVAPRHRSEQSSQVTAGALPNLWTRETPRDAGKEGVKLGLPRLQDGGGRRIERRHFLSLRHGSLLRSQSYPQSAAVVLGLVAVSQAAHGTGADWLLAPMGQVSMDSGGPDLGAPAYLARPG